jgi:hypothetical protein
MSRQPQNRIKRGISMTRLAQSVVRESLGVNCRLTDKDLPKVANQDILMGWMAHIVFHPSL